MIYVLLDDLRDGSTLTWIANDEIIAAAILASIYVRHGADPTKIRATRQLKWDAMHERGDWQIRVELLP